MSHYFSRAHLTARPRDSELLRMLARHGGAYRDHALVWRLFPGDGAPRDFVFRSDADERERAVFYIVSQREPRDVDGLFQLQSKRYLPQLGAGELLHFDLRANPTISRRNRSGKSQRHDVLMDAKQKADSPQQVNEEMEQAGRAWLLGRASSWGLEVEPGSVLQTGYQQHRLRPKDKRIEFSSLDYRGVARVTDPMALQRALLNGVGHARGFGCGLLLVRRPG